MSWQVFYAQIRKLLELGGKQVEVRYKPGCWRKRIISETDVTSIEGWCGFENFNKVQGFNNVRVASRKHSPVFYNIIVKVEGEHTENLKDQTQHAVFRVTVAALNPLGNTHFPDDFVRSSNNIALLSRYLRNFPIRMHRDGYTVDKQLRSICKHINRRGATTTTGDGDGEGGDGDTEVQFPQ